MSLMLVVREMICIFVVIFSPPVRSGKEKQQSNKHYVDGKQMDKKYLLVDWKINEMGVKLFTQNTLNVLKMYE